MIKPKKKKKEKLHASACVYLWKIWIHGIIDEVSDDLITIDAFEV